MVEYEGKKAVQELNSRLCIAQCELCDRDLELIFMLWPRLCAPLLPVALKEPMSQRAEGMGNSGGQRRLKKRRRHMTERN